MELEADQASNTAEQSGEGQYDGAQRTARDSSGTGWGDRAGRAVSRAGGRASANSAHASEVSGPAAGNTMTAAYVQMVGRMAYVWGYAMVNAHNRRAAFAEAPEPGLLGVSVPIAPVGYNAMLTGYVAADERFIVSPNQDVVYGAGFTALDKEPTVFQVPDFGDRFWVYALYDQRTDEIGQFGKQYGTEPGFYMIVGRDWQGEVPQGIKGVVRSSTARFSPFRAFSRIRPPRIPRQCSRC